MTHAEVNARDASGFESGAQGSQAEGLTRIRALPEGVAFDLLYIGLEAHGHEENPLLRARCFGAADRDDAGGDTERRRRRWRSRFDGTRRFLDGTRRYLDGTRRSRWDADPRWDEPRPGDARLRWAAAGRWDARPPEGVGPRWAGDFPNATVVTVTGTTAAATATGTTAAMEATVADMAATDMAMATGMAVPAGIGAGAGAGAGPAGPGTGAGAGAGAIPATATTASTLPTMAMATATPTVDTATAAAAATTGRPASGDWGAVKTDVSPEEARIMLDGRYIGTADDFDGYPDMLYLKPGTYHLEFQLEGFEPQSVEIEARAGVRAEINNKLKKIPGAKAYGSYDTPVPEGGVQRFFGKSEEFPSPRSTSRPTRDTSPIGGATIRRIRRRMGIRTRRRWRRLPARAMTIRRLPMRNPGRRSPRRRSPAGRRKPGSCFGWSRRTRPSTSTTGSRAPGRSFPA